MLEESLVCSSRYPIFGRVYLKNSFPWWAEYSVCLTPLEASHVRLHLEYSVRYVRIGEVNGLIVAPGLKMVGEDGMFFFKALV